MAPSFEGYKPAETAAPPPAPHQPPAAAPAAPPPKPREKLKAGDAQKKAVDQLRSDLSKTAGELGFEVGEPTDFGHSFDVYDPETGLMFSAARADHRDSGMAPVMMTPDEVVTTIVSTRRHAETAGLVRYADQVPKEEAKPNK
jgi:hypothetical protein